MVVSLPDSLPSARFPWQNYVGQETRLFLACLGWWRLICWLAHMGLPGSVTVKQQKLGLTWVLTGVGLVLDAFL